MDATPYKLKNGDWGVRVKGDVEEGDIVTVVAKDGKSWETKIKKVLFTFDDGNSLCSTSYLESRGNGRKKVAKKRVRKTKVDDTECHTGGNCAGNCEPKPVGGDCPCANGFWFDCA